MIKFVVSTDIGDWRVEALSENHARAVVEKLTSGRATITNVKRTEV